jgi:hypothetical protein
VVSKQPREDSNLLPHRYFMKCSMLSEEKLIAKATIKIVVRVQTANTTLAKNVV